MLTTLLKPFLKILLLSFATCVSALPLQAPVPGGIAILALPNYGTDVDAVHFQDRPAAILSYGESWLALGAIPLNATVGDQYRFTVQYRNGVSMKTSVTVLEKNYPEQRLIIKDRRKVNPEPRDMERIAAESKRKRAAKARWSETVPAFDFIWPAEGRISSVFGLRRFFNDQERNPHNGLDIAADTGTPVLATAGGTVIESGDFFFSGNMVFIDHGRGIISLYAHMDRIDVAVGDVVQQGQHIGTVGQTGRATGPHLHFALLANNELFDPEYVLPSPKQARNTRKY